MLIAPEAAVSQYIFDPDTVRFEKVTGPEFGMIYKNDMLFDSRGILWVAAQSGLYAFDGYEWKSGLSHPNDPHLSVDPWLESVQEDSLGYIWFGSNISGVHRLNPQTLEITPYPSPDNGSAVRLGQEILLNDPYLTIQTQNGFYHLNPYTGMSGEWYIPFPGDERKGANIIRHYLEDDQNPNVAWLGTRLGLVKYLKDAGEAIPFDWPMDNPRRSPGDKISVTDLHQAGDSLLACTYGAGFVTYRKDGTTWRTDLIEPYDTYYDHGLWANMIEQLTPVDDTTILFAASPSAGIYNWRSGESQLFHVDDKLDWSGGYRNVLVDHNGCVWTNNFAEGIYRSVTPLFSKKQDPKLLITKLSISERDDMNGYFSGSFDLVTLEENQNTIGIAYCLVNPVSPEKVTYEYMLAGYDDEWVSAGQSRFVRFANLRPGQYAFRVRALDADGRQYEDQLFRFGVVRPFYKSGWFYTMLSVLGLVLIYYIYRTNLEKARVSARLKDSDLQIARLEMQALHSQMNPHFIFNSLNSIKNYIVNKGTDTAADYLTLFSQLIRVILENSKSELLTLEQEIKALNLYIEIEKMRFKENFDFEISIDSDIDQQSFKIPSMIIQPYVENSIWHGLMHKEGDRMLKLQILGVDNGILVIVEDNGIGRSRAHDLARTRKHNRQSLATRITRERIDMINKLYGVHIFTETEDMKNSEGDPTGTRVKVYIENLSKRGS